jgi:hypothetical protein
MINNKFEEPLIFVSIGSNTNSNENKIIYTIQFQSEFSGKIGK